MSSFVAAVVIGLSIVSAVFASAANEGDTLLLHLLGVVLLLIMGTAPHLSASARRRRNGGMDKVDR